jgi:hypothetical protein
VRGTVLSAETALPERRELPGADRGWIRDGRGRGGRYLRYIQELHSIEQVFGDGGKIDFRAGDNNHLSALEDLANFFPSLHLQEGIRPENEVERCGGMVLLQRPQGVDSETRTTPLQLKGFHPKGVEPGDCGPDHLKAQLIGGDLTVHFQWIEVGRDEPDLLKTEFLADPVCDDQMGNGGRVEGAPQQPHRPR